MTSHRRLAFACCLVLAACNQSDSHDISADKLVLHARLYAQDQAVIKASLGKENSTVVVVLNGGDYMEVSDGVSHDVMEYRDNLINDVHYRATLPLSTDKSYTLTLNRASQHQLYASTFPIIPESFAITFPIDQQSISLASNPFLNMYWDTKVHSSDLLLRTTYNCYWTLTSALNGEQSTVENTKSDEIMLETNQREARSATLVLQQKTGELKDDILHEHPRHEANLQDCRVKIELAAQNHGFAHSGLSEQSQLSSIREQAITIDLQP